MSETASTAEPTPGGSGALPPGDDSSPEVAAGHEASVIECPPTPEHVPSGLATPPPSTGRNSGVSRKRKVGSMVKT